MLEKARRSLYDGLDMYGVHHKRKEEEILQIRLIYNKIMMYFKQSYNISLLKKMKSIYKINTDINDKHGR